MFKQCQIQQKFRDPQTEIHKEVWSKLSLQRTVEWFNPRCSGTNMDSSAHCNLSRSDHRGALLQSFRSLHSFLKMPFFYKIGRMQAISGGWIPCLRYSWPYSLCRRMFRWESILDPLVNKSRQIYCFYYSFNDAFQWLIVLLEALKGIGTHEDALVFFPTEESSILTPAHR